MGLPSINITFRQQGITAVQRGERGVVALVLQDQSAVEAFEVTAINDIPDGLSERNKDLLEKTLIGYVTPPRKVVVYVVAESEEGADYSDAQAYLETVAFDYVAVPGITSSEANSFATWVKGLRENHNKKVVAVLPNTNADHEGIVNFTTDDIWTEEGRYDTSEYTGRIAGLLAGTPLTIASTFAPLPEVIDCERLTNEELDEAIDNGEFVIFNDGEKVKVGRGVNSLVTTTQEKTESFKKIKIVAAMDLMYHDIKRTAEDHYLGKYSNSYDNKILLMVAIQGYLEGLELDGVLEAGTTDVFIDVERQLNYLKSIGYPGIDEMNEQEVKNANTRDQVFLGAQIKILDAIEEITLAIEF